MRPVLGVQSLVAALQPLGVDRHASVAGIAAALLSSLSNSMSARLSGNSLVRVYDALDLAVDLVDLRHAGIIGRLVRFRVPIRLLDQSLERRANSRALFPESLNAHGISFH